MTREPAAWWRLALGFRYQTPDSVRLLFFQVLLSPTSQDMRRRGIGGMSAIDKTKKHEAKFQEKSNEIAENQLVKLSEQMEAFRNHLQEFATKHRKEIRKSPEFRKQFQEMCAAVGVDPLQSSSNFWTKLLGVGDFYYELAIQIIEVCMSTSHRTGGFMQLNELVRRVKASRNVAKVRQGSSADEIDEDDVLKAIEKLSILGGGIKSHSIRQNIHYSIRRFGAEFGLHCRPC